MRKIPLSAALLVAAAFATTAVAAGVFVRLAGAPRAAQQLPEPLEPDLAHALAVVSTPTGLSVVYANEAFTIDAGLRWSRLGWRESRTAAQGLRALGFHLDEAPAGPLPWLFVAGAGDRLTPFEITRDRETTTTEVGGRRLSLRNVDGTLLARSDGPWLPAASVLHGHELVAHPFGDGWLALNHHGPGELVRLDARGHRMLATGLFRSVGILSHTPAHVWLGVLGGLAALGLLTLLSLRRALRPVGELRVGVLKLPPGAVVMSDRRRRAAIPDGAAVLVDGARVELGPGLLRSDAAPGFPLVDGAEVYVVGRVTAVVDAGPWRSSHRVHLVPDRGRYLLGRGSPAELVRARCDQLRMVAFVHLAFGAALLGALALRTPA